MDIRRLHRRNFPRFRITRLYNNTFIATIDHSAHLNQSSGAFSSRDDDQGALIYVIAVLCVCGLSIILMIASEIKRSKSDHRLSRYMHDIDIIRKIERREEHKKAKRAMQMRERTQQQSEAREKPSSEEKEKLRIEEAQSSRKGSLRGSKSCEELSQGKGYKFSDDQQLLLSQSSGEQNKVADTLRLPPPSLTCAVSLGEQHYSGHGARPRGAEALRGGTGEVLRGASSLTMDLSSSPLLLHTLQEESDEDTQYESDAAMV